MHPNYIAEHDSLRSAPLHICEQYIHTHVEPSLLSESATAGAYSMAEIDAALAEIGDRPTPKYPHGLDIHRDPFGYARIDWRGFGGITGISKHERLSDAISTLLYYGVANIRVVPVRDIHYGVRPVQSPWHIDQYQVFSCIQPCVRVGAL